MFSQRHVICFKLLSHLQNETKNYVYDNGKARKIILGNIRDVIKRLMLHFKDNCQESDVFGESSWKDWEHCKVPIVFAIIETKSTLKVLEIS